MDPSNTSRRGFLKLAGLAGLSASAVGTLAACGGGTQPTQPGAGGSAPAGGGARPAAAASYWFLSGQPQQGDPRGHGQALQRANPDTQIKYTEFQNDAYKTKIKTAIGAGQGPTIIWGWGGGGLREYVKNNQVEDLTSFFAENAALKDKLLPVRLRGGHRRRQDLRDAGRDGHADRLLLEQEGLRQGRRPAPAVVGRDHGPGAEVQRGRHRAVLARRPVPLDEHDVARVPARPHRAAPRSSRTPSPARRTPGPTRPCWTC